MRRPAIGGGPEPGRIRALDGLRGLAVVAVLLFHSGHLVGGYLGVDLFFVLSGFLITGLILGESERTGRIKLTAFWARRARRLLPALFLMLGGVAAYAAFVAGPTQLGSIRADALATLGYVANWHSILAGHSYWKLFSAPSPLRHTWSLAIEEQFYLVWPLIIATLAVGARRAHALPRRVFAFAFGGAVGLGALSVGLSLAGASSKRLYLGTDTRAPAILLGAALAAWVSWRGPVRSTAGRAAVQVAALLGVAWLAWAWTHLDGRDPFLARGGLLLCGVAAVAVIASVTQSSRGPVMGACTVPPLCWLGLVSYGVYLWHWPVYLWLSPARVGLGGWSLVGLRVAVTLLIATGSYYVVEMPIRRGALRGWPIRAATPAAVTLTVAAVLVATTGAVSASSTVQVAASSRRRASAPTSAAAVGQRARILVVGDSVGVSLGARLEEMQQLLAITALNGSEIGCEQIPVSDFRRQPDRGDGTAGAAIPTTTTCRGWPARWSAALARAHPDHVLLVLGFPAVFDVEVQGVWHPACGDWWRATYTAQLTAAIRMLASTGAKVGVATIARPGADYFPESLNSKVDCVNRVLRETTASAGASVVDVADYVCPHRGSCGAFLDGQLLRPDGLHFANPGGRALATWVVRQLTGAAVAIPTRARPARTGRVDEQLHLALTGTVSLALDAADRANACTVLRDKAELDCELVPKDHPYRIDLRIAPFSGPGVYRATTIVQSTTSLMLYQLDDSRLLVGAFAPTSGTIVVRRANVNAGPVASRNASAIGSLDAVLDVVFRSPAITTGVAGPIHISGTFQCPLSGADA